MQSATRAVGSPLVSPPEPAGLPLLGHLLRFFRDPLGLLEEAGALGDVVRMRLGPYRAYLLNNPEDVKTVLVTAHRKLEKKSPIQLGARLVLGQGLATSEGPFHLRQRRLIQPAFHRARIDAYGRDFSNITERHISAWRDGEVLDVAEEMTKLTLAIVAKTLFDADIAEEAQELGEIVKDLTILFNTVLLPFPQLRQKLPLPSTRRFARSRARLDATIYRFISDHRKTGVDRGDLLSMLLQTKYEDTGEPMPDHQVRDEALTLFAAGHETSANALTWMFYLLSQHPEELSRVTAQVDAVLGGRLPTPADLPKMPALRQVVAETLRLYPPGWLMSLVPLEQLTLSGVSIAKDSMVMMSPWLMHRDRRFFPEPLAFRPGRWTPQMQEGLHKFAFFPFGGGPRVCIGDQFAWMELAMVLAVCCARFRLELAPDARVEAQPVLTLRARHGMKMIARRVHRAS